ncbi:MAG: hypothetical protein RR365_11005 [Bacteroides sp.]
MAAILQVVRDALRRTSTALDDTELTPLIEAAKIDLSGAGVRIINESDPLIQAAIRLFVLYMVEKDDKQRSFYEQLKNGMAMDSRYGG